MAIAGKKEPFISIIIPTRNEEKRLQYCLPSILQQSFQDFEIIIVEDPETNDGTEDYVKSLKSDKINYLIHPPQIRVPAKRNIGAGAARGKYVYIIDADMEMPEGLLQSLHDQIEKEKVDMMFVAERIPGGEWLANIKDLEKQIIQKEVSLIAARIYKRSVFEKSGGYKEHLIANEEVELSDRLVTEGKKYSFSNSNINHYETSGSNILRHLKKKFKYGTTANDYFESVDESKDLASKRSGSSRLIYFTSPLTWKNPILGIQFVIFKFIEMSVLTTGMIYGKLFNTNTITTN